MASQAREHLAQTDAAMLRLAQGSYGTCDSCGQQTRPACLTARPVTTACITCAPER